MMDGTIWDQDMKRAIDIVRKHFPGKRVNGWLAQDIAAAIRDARGEERADASALATNQRED